MDYSQRSGHSEPARPAERGQRSARGRALLATTLVVASMGAAHGAAGPSPAQVTDLDSALLKKLDRNELKVSRDLAAVVRQDLGKVVRFIVQTNEAPSYNYDRLAQANGARVQKRFGNFRMLVCTATGRLMLRLVQNPGIRCISPDRPVGARLDYTTTAVGAPAAWDDGIGGAGVTVAVLDSGIAPHLDLVRPKNRIVGWADLINNRYQPYDDNGHGTHVAGIIAGNGMVARAQGLPQRLQGIAPQARLVGVKVLDAAGHGTASTVIAGLDWCITNRARFGLRVLNLSVGTPVRESYLTDPICQACEKAVQAGLLVVTPAGNRGRSIANDPNSPTAYGTIDCPGNDPYVLTVGATKTLATFAIGDDGIASYSSRGPTLIDRIVKPDLVAPGNRVVSLSAQTGGYVEMSGTSMAAPVAAGAAALMFSAHPMLTPGDVKARLMKTALKLWKTDGSTPDIFSRGAGYLNIPGALACTARVLRPVRSPRVVNSNGIIRLMDPQTQVANAFWGDNALWGDAAIWGDAALWGDTALWSDQAIWGDNALWGDSAIWSDAAIWGDSALWAD